MIFFIKKNKMWEIIFKSNVYNSSKKLSNKKEIFSKNNLF